MKLWKCYNCHDSNSVPGRDFVAPEPVCPECGLSGRDAGGTNLVVPRVTIHYQPPHETVKRRGAENRACDGKPNAGGVSTAEPAVVNCAKCRETAAFKKALEERGDLEPHNPPHNQPTE